MGTFCLSPVRKNAARDFGIFKSCLLMTIVQGTLSAGSAGSVKEKHASVPRLLPQLQQHERNFARCA
jgi:hypothetical protein